MAAVEAGKPFQHQAPLELAGEFVSAVMRRDFHDALVLCQALLLLEPTNKTYLEFEKVLKEAKSRNITMDTDDEDSDEEDENNNAEEDSDNSDSSLCSDKEFESDSGNSGLDDTDGDESDLSEIDSSSADEEEDEEEDTDTSSDGLSNLNLLVGGLSINRSK